MAKLTLDRLRKVYPNGFVGVDEASFEIGDGELLVLREGRVQTFNVLQQRLNRKSVTPKLMKDYPIHLRAYDLLSNGENDLRMLPFSERRDKLARLLQERRRRLPGTEPWRRCRGSPDCHRYWHVCRRASQAHDRRHSKLRGYVRWMCISRPYAQTFEAQVLPALRA